MAFSLATSALGSPIDTMNVPKDSCQQGHRIGGSPGRARDAGRAVDGSSILVTNVMSKNARTMTVCYLLLYFYQSTIKCTSELRHFTAVAKKTAAKRKERVCPHICW